MLIDFSFSNYRSFRDQQSFSMMRQDKAKAVTQQDCSRVAAVYGANASGKSNFLNALRFMASTVRTSYSGGDATSGVTHDAFALCTTDGASPASQFFVEFVADDDQKYQYWFTLDDTKIENEQLMVYRRLGERLSTHSSLLFSRDEGGAVKFGTQFKGSRAQIQSTIRLRPNALLLSAAAAGGISSIMPVFDFFAKNFIYCEALAYEQEAPSILLRIERDPDYADELSTLIRYADFGITAVESASVSLTPSEREKLRMNLSEGFGMEQKKIEELLNSKQRKLLFNHVGADETSVSFGEGRESRGTLAALSFFSLALRSLSRRTVTVVDEIDTSLHPSLVRDFIALYADSATNPHGSQLIFTTHDVSLITGAGTVNRLLDPDQIWLVEKDAAGTSEIYPLTQLHLRKGENIGRNYLNGVYGAVPKTNFHTAFARIIEQSEETTVLSDRAEAER
ncbi:MAG: ATP-binding protein [Bifidobacterium sp.]|jgi:AAA15 family ATPase/GTPase